MPTWTAFAVSQLLAEHLPELVDYHFTADRTLSDYAADAQVRRLTMMDVNAPVEPVINLSVPKHFNARNAKSRKELAATMRIKVPHDTPAEKHSGAAGSGEEKRVSELRRQMRAHPCHSCPDRENHARCAERWWRLRRETDRVARTVEGRSNSVARIFDRVCELLVDLGYLTEGGAAVTEQGDYLKRLYTEKDLLAPSACDSASGSASMRRALPRSSRRCFTSRGATRRTSRPGCPMTTSARRTRRWSGGGACSRTASIRTCCRRPPARMPEWPG